MRARQLLSIGIVACIFVIGLELRFRNARSAFVHDDEIHYVEDGAWSFVRLTRAETVDFLRKHPSHHARLDPTTSRLERWGENGLYPRLGHPPLYAIALGTMFTLSPPRGSITETVRTARRLNAVVDSATVLLMPALLRRFGAPTWAGVAAAAVYAIYPPAITYGSLAYLDAFLAPLFTALVIVVATPPRGVAAWMLAGILTGLLVGTKQTGLIAVVVIPAMAVATSRKPLAGLLVWIVAGLATLSLLVSPASYLSGLVDPLDPYARLRPDPLQAFFDNLGFWARPHDWYWLSFAKHGNPMAATFAVTHRLFTPTILLLYVSSLTWGVYVRRWKFVSLVGLPLAGLAILLPPSDGMWRTHIITPLLCAAAVFVIVASHRYVRASLVTAAIVLVVWPVLPPGPSRIGLEDFLATNSALASAQQHTVFDSFRGRPLVVDVTPSTSIHRRVRLSEGTYEAKVSATSWTVVTLDGEVVFSGVEGRQIFEVSGFFHTMKIEFLGLGTLREFTIRPVAK